MDDSLLNESEKIIESVKFPSQPGILVEIREEMNKTEPEFKKIAKLIDKDLALTAKIIKLVNSAYYGLRHEIKSIGHALALLGLQNFNNIVLASSMREALVSKNMPAKQFDIFFDHSLMVAKVSEIISKKLVFDFDDVSSFTFVYMAGLFHDCGIVLLAKRFPEDFDKITKGSRANLSIEKIEEENFNCNHSAVGCLAARTWKLPGLVCQVIRYHHQEDISLHKDISLRKMLANVMLAESIIAQYSGYSDSGNIDLYHFKVSSEEMFTNLLQELDLTIEELTEIQEIVEDIVGN